jgi:hypothetical protein
MKKIFVLLVLAFFIFEAKSASAGVAIYFNFQDVSEIYVKFTYQFGVQFGAKAKQYHFSGEHQVEILEGMAFIDYQDGVEEERVIVAIINKEKKPSIWVRVKDLDNEEKIRKKAKEFSERILEKLREIEGRKKTKV